MFIARRSLHTDYSRQSADSYRLQGATKAVLSIAEAFEKSIYEYNKGTADAIELKVVAGPLCIEYEVTTRINPDEYSVFMTGADTVDLAGGESLLDLYFSYYSNTERSSPEALMRMMAEYAGMCGMKVGCRSCRYTTGKCGTEQAVKCEAVCADPYDLYNGTSNLFLSACSAHAVGAHGYYSTEKEARDMIASINAGLSEEEIDDTLLKCLIPVTQITL